MAPVSKAVHPPDRCARSLDQAVGEIFHLMMDVACIPVARCSDDSLETISAVIGFAGAMSGTCMLRSSEHVALRMAERLTGASISNLDETVQDAVGEICNMIAGAWKSQQPRLTFACMLSTPTVVTGTNYYLHTQKPEFKIEQSYNFEKFTFTVTLACESME